jgi:succinate dehydrogenase cytochrome b556 subunit
MKLRPISPHLTIYSAQLTSSLSIFHRVSGVSLLIIMILMSIFIFLCTSFSYNSVFNELYICSLSLFQFLITTEIIWYTFLSSIMLISVYHTLNGFRHICWDLKLFLNIKDVYITGYVVVFMSLVISLIFVLYYL